METSLLNHFFMQSWGCARWLYATKWGKHRIVRKHLLVSEPVTEGLRARKKEKPESTLNSAKGECVAQL